MISRIFRRNFIKKSLLLVIGLFGFGALLMNKKKQKKIKTIIQPGQKHWVGNGFYVNTMFHPSQSDYSLTDPFVLLDYASPKEFEKNSVKRGVGEHPHRGFETVTFALQGEIEHRDSSGGGGTITEGGVQWMSAAGGVVHEEFHSRKFSEQGGMLEMVQLWVNLPKKHKMNQPKYQGVSKEDFPVYDQAGCKLKVVAGKHQNLEGPCQTYSDINIFELEMKKDASLEIDLAESTNTLVLGLKGGVIVEGKHIEQNHLGILTQDGEQLRLIASEDSKVLVLNGKPLNEPIVAHGPFVMNTKQEIIQAIDDYKRGKLGRL